MGSGSITIMTAVSARADRAGAVNTLTLNSGHVLLGDNTDGHGLVTDLTQNLGLAIRNLRILILGAEKNACNGVPCS